MRRNGVDAPSHPLDSSCDQNAATTWIQGKRGSGTIGSTTRCGTYPLETRKTGFPFFVSTVARVADPVDSPRWPALLCCGLFDSLATDQAAGYASRSPSRSARMRFPQYPGRAPARIQLTKYHRALVRTVPVVAANRRTSDHCDALHPAGDPAHCDDL